MAGLERDREQGLPDKATSVFCFLETFFFFSPIHKHVKILFLSCGYFSCFQFLFSVFFFFNFKFLFLLYFTLQYCIGFAIHWHESATGVHKFPILNPTSHLSPHISLDHPSASAKSILYPVSNLGWQFISYMIAYMFQCHSPKLFHNFSYILLY